MRTWRFVLAPTVLLLAACGSANPFARSDEDFAKTRALQRLRTLPEAGLAQFERPVPASDRTLEGVLGNVRAAREAFKGLDALALPIEECRAEAIRNNLSLKVSLLEPAIARERVSEEDNRFNSAFTLRGSYSDAEFPTASRLSSSAQESISINPGVRIPTRTGGSVAVDLLAERGETNNEFSVLNPAYQSDVRLTLSHPLLRNAGRRATTAPLRIAGYAEQSSRARTKLEVIRQLAATERTYWNLYGALESLEVRLRQFDIAKEQLDRAQRRVDGGVSSEVEVDRAKSGAAQRLEAIVLAQNDVLLRSRELKATINKPGVDVDTKLVLRPSTPPDPVRYEFDREKLQTLAVENRMELLELQLQLAADAVQIGLDRNRTLPLVDLQYVYRLNGLGEDFGKAFETMGEADFADWSLGVNAEIPLDNGEARARLRRSLLTRLQRLASKDAREQSIRREVLDAADALETGWQRILAAQQAVVLAQRSLESEQRQFDLGKSTSNDVLDAASRLGDAQLAEVRAIVDYQVSQADMAFATGTVLGATKADLWGDGPEPDLSRPDPREEDALPK